MVDRFDVALLSTLPTMVPTPVSVPAPSSRFSAYSVPPASVVVPPVWLKVRPRNWTLSISSQALRLWFVLT
jgi:hypothetical protein